jgi:hypothetical protein
MKRTREVIELCLQGITEKVVRWNLFGIQQISGSRLPRLTGASWGHPPICTIVLDAGTKSGSPM